MDFDSTVLAVAWPTIGLTVGVLFLLANVGYWILAWRRYFPITLRVIDQQPLLVPEPGEPLESGEECEFRTRDGLTLRGTYLKTPAEERLGVVLFGHELFGDRWNAAPYVRELLRDGYDIFTFDMRNHGNSDADPRFKPRPWISNLDVIDARAAIDYLASRPDADARGIGLLGISRGGGALLCAAAGDPRVRCVLTDGAYPSQTTHMLYMRRYAEIYVPRSLHWSCRLLPDWVFDVFLGAARRTIARQNGFSFVNVERLASKVSQPVLMIHGECDTMIPIEAVQAMKARLAGPSKLWVVPEARHNGSIASNPDEYQRRLSRFFGMHLARRRPGVAKATNTATADDSSVAA